MEAFVFSGLINGILALFFGGVIFLKDSRSRSNRLFFLMTLSISFWAFSYWKWLSSAEVASALLWVRLLSISSMFIPVLFFHWVSSVLKIVDTQKVLIRSAYGIVVFFSLFAFTELFIRGLGPKLIFPLWPEPGILYSLYLVLIYIGLTSYSLILRSYKTVSQSQRGQIIYIILGMAFGFGGGISNFFLWYNIPILPYGNF